MDVDVDVDVDLSRPGERLGGPQNRTSGGGCNNTHTHTHNYVDVVMPA